MADASFVSYVALHKKGLVNDNLLPLGHMSSDLMGEMPTRSSLTNASPRLNPWSLPLDGRPRWSRSLIEVEVSGKVQGRLSMYLPLEPPPMASIPIHWTPRVKGFIRVFKDETSIDHSHAPAAGTVYSSDMLEHARRATTILLDTVLPSRRLEPGKDDFLVLFEPSDSEACTGTSPASDIITRNTLHKLNDYGLVKVKGQEGRSYVFQGIAPTPAGSRQTLRINAQRFPSKHDILHRPDILAPSEDLPIVELSLGDCDITALPARYAVSAACIPAILHCLENAMIARELQQTLLAPVGIDDLDLIIEATTSSGASHDKHYERLEYLGDAVLKYLTHVQLMAQYPHWPEGLLTGTKGRTNGNNSLADSALRTGLDRFVSTQFFRASKWRPPYTSDITTTQVKEVKLSTKTLADVVEALIGASYLQKGLDGALACTKVFLPEEQWLKFEAAHDLLQGSVSASSTPDFQVLEELIGYGFSNPSLLLEATTHSSHTRSLTSSYERLEFLGDAVLDQIIVPTLFKHSSQLKNYEMHNLRQALANSHFLGFLCMEHSIDQERTNVSSDSGLLQDVDGFTLVPASHKVHLPDFLRCEPKIAILRRNAMVKHAELRDELTAALHHGSDYPWPLLYQLQPQKFFCDMIEALVGAIYIDSRGSLDTCRAFLERLGFMNLMHRFLNDAVNVESPKQRLGQLANAAEVNYNTTVSKADDSQTRIFSCTVKVGVRDMASVGGCAYRDEAEVKAAAKAIQKLEEERQEVHSRKRARQDDDEKMGED